MSSGTNDYYRILHIKPEAGQEEIVRAIAKIRGIDTAGNYEATINRIEATLTDPERRAAYDLENGFTDMRPTPTPVQDFFDLDLDTLDNHRAGNHQVSNVIEALEENSVFSPRNQRRLKARESVNFGRIFLFLVLLLIGLAAFVLSKPLLDRFDGKKHADSAMIALYDAQKQVERYIRENGVFPDASELQIDLADRRFHAQIDSGTQRIFLRFQNNVVSKLQNAELVSTFIARPNLTYWQCDPGNDFPTEYRPASCY